MSVNNIVVVSDLHSGCRLALLGPEGATLDDGGIVAQSPLQKKLWAFWREFWDEFVPEATRKEPFAVVNNGDSINGKPHGAETNISDNLVDQAAIAEVLLTPVVKACKGRYFHIRGTEAHVGKSGQCEEALAKTLKARANHEGKFARYDLWIRCGPKLCHFLHHVGTTGSAAYEATAVHKELTESYVEAARWNREPPDLIGRAHRHRHIEIKVSSGRGNAIAVVSPAWQGKTPFAWKIPGARLAEPQFGGYVVRYAHGRLFVDSYVRTIERSPTEICEA